jgi:SAM-dependent methyltransferase
MTDLADEIVGRYERHAIDWDADRRKSCWNDERWHARFANKLPIGTTVLDLGCGGGVPVAAHLLSRGLRVTGIDSSPTLISLCRSRFPRYEWVVADMRTLALGRTFDGVLAWDSFFHLRPEDQRRMFGVFSAHAAENCMLMFNTGPRHGESIGSYGGDPFYHASLDSAEYADLLASFGFELIDHTIEDPLAGGRTVWVAQKSH